MSRSGRSRIVVKPHSPIVARNHSTIRLPGYQTIRLQKGQASIELLLVLLILIPLLLGGIELARGVGIRHSLDSGVGVATRALSLDPSQWDWSISVINQTIQDNILGGGSVSAVTIKVYNASGTQISSDDLAALPFGVAFRLEASCTYTPEIVLVGGQTVTIRVSHWGIMERYP